MDKTCLGDISFQQPSHLRKEEDAAEDRLPLLLFKPWPLDTLRETPAHPLFED